MWRQLINELMPQHDRPACPVGLLNEVRIAENGCVLFVSFILIPLIAVQKSDANNLLPATEPKV